MLPTCAAARLGAGACDFHQRSADGQKVRGRVPGLQGLNYPSGGQKARVPPSASIAAPVSAKASEIRYRDHARDRFHLEPRTARARSCWGRAATPALKSARTRALPRRSCRSARRAATLRRCPPVPRRGRRLLRVVPPETILRAVRGESQKTAFAEVR